MNYTEEMAGFMAGLALEDIPDHIRRLARVNLMDAVGVIIGGHAFLEHENDGRLGRYLDLLPGADQATALGFHRRSSLQAAGFANGTLSEVLDWQDTTMSARVHSGSGTVPAVLAAAEWRESTGEEMVRAMAVGYEVGARVGVAMQPSHWHEGFQATGTIGAIGAAAAVGSLMGFGPSQMANVLGVAGYILAISNGDGVFHGYTIKPVHGGMAAQAGIQAALLVESGYEAGPLEGLEPRKHGFMNIASEDVRPERLTEGLGSTWESSVCSQKLYPVGLLIVGPVQVTLDLVNRHQISADQVESVLVTSYSETLHFVGRHYTTTNSTYVDAHLSLPYAVAVAIADAEYGWRQQSSGRIADPAVHDLASRVTVDVDESMDETYPDDWPVRVEITLKDGRKVADRLDKVTGCPNRPMTDAELCGKFVGNVEGVIGADRAEAARDTFMGLESLGSAPEIVELLAPTA